MAARSVRRREFLKRTAAMSAAWAAAGTLSARAYGQVGGANARLNIGIIGAGGRGGANLTAVAGERSPSFTDTPPVSGTRLAALCDVDLRREGPRPPTPAQMFERFDAAAKYHDYRRMLDETQGDIDAVVVSTPNHHHAPASVMAMRRGKHVYCEKPGANTVAEARLMAEAAAEAGVATQLGTQVHSSENFRRVVELIRAGAIGEVSECHLWNRGGGFGETPGDQPPVPEELRWNLWLGPAPQRPYHPIYIPTRWHGWWDFGGGTLGNMGCHYFDLPFWALDLKHPKTVEAEGPEPHPENAPGQLHVRHVFEREGGGSPITLTWTHGNEGPAIFREHNLPGWAWGVFVGDTGMLLVSYPQHELRPAEAFEGYERPEPSIPPSVGHHQEWVNACRGEGEALCDFSYSMRVTEAVLLGNVAYRSGEKLEWSADDLTIPNAPDAEAFLHREYREGWQPV